MPVADAADAAGGLADGRLEVRVVDPGMGPEFMKPATSVNGLAACSRRHPGTR